MATVEVLWSLWAKHAKVPRWVRLETGMKLQRATDEMIVRQDRVRRSGEPCRFKLLPDGKEPDER